jgi:uncharacterized protein YdcH (DUF465 family)
MNAAEGPEIKNQLLQSDHHYRDLAERHHELDDRIHRLSDQHFLTDSEQVEEVTLKKQKLALKDQMEAIARVYTSGHSRAS